MEEKSEPKRPALILGDDDFRGRPIGEKCVTQLFLSGDTRFAQALVRREVLDELEDERDVGGFRAPDLNRIRQIPEPR